MVVRLRAVGECAIDVGPTRVGPEAELAFAVLLVLAMARGHTVTRRRLTDLLWPGAPDDRARHNLRQTLYKLRQLGAPVESESLHVRLPAESVAPNPLLDADADGEGAEAAELLRADRPFGEFLAGYVPTFSAPFAAWIDEQRSVIHARLRRAALTRLHDDRRRGDWAAVETLARKVLQLDALNEEATLALAEATVMTGSKRAAIAQLDAYLRELGPDAGDIRLPATLLRRRIAERLPASLSPPDGDPCFIGRAESLAFLHDQFRLARNVSARTVLVWGDAGIGKSRLTTEFARLAVMEGAQLARVGCQARDVERPLSVFVDVVPHLLALPGAIGCSPESMTYLRRLTAHDPTVLEPAAETREAELLFAYVRRAILDLVDAVAAESSLVLVFEDVHWLDEQSWRVLRELIGWLERRRVLVVLTSRLPHATPTRPAREAAGVVEHRLGPLDREASLALFDAATPGGAVPADYREWCVQVADGNPLFLCACAQDTTRHQTQVAPTSLTRTIAERVRAVAPAPWRALQAIAVLGAIATGERVRALLGLTRYELLDAVQQLNAKRLVRHEEGAIICHHALITDAVIAHTSECELSVLHQAAADVLEGELRSSHDPKLLWECAHHWLAAGESKRAVALVQRSGAHLLSIGAARAALDVYQRGLAIAPPSDERLPLLAGVSQSASVCGRWRDCVAAISELNALRRAHGLPPQHELLALEARWRLAECPDNLLAGAERLLCEASGATHRRLAAGVLALIFSDHLCDHSAATRVHASCVALSCDSDDVELRTLCDTVALVYHSSFGDLATAVRLARALTMRRRHDDAIQAFRDSCRASIPLRRHGDFRTADAVVSHALTLVTSHGMIAPQCIAADILASSAFEQGRVEDAQMWWQSAVELVASVDPSETVISVGYVGVRIALALGDVSLAQSRLPSATADVLRDSNVRRRIEGTAAHLAVAVAQGDLTAIARLLPSLREDHFRARSCGGQDYATTVLVTGMRLIGRRDEARAIATAYIAEFRREQGELPHYFTAGAL